MINFILFIFPISGLLIILKHAYYTTKEGYSFEPFGFSIKSPLFFKLLKKFFPAPNVFLFFLISKNSQHLKLKPKPNVFQSLFWLSFIVVFLFFASFFSLACLVSCPNLEILQNTKQKIFLLQVCLLFFFIK